MTRTSYAFILGRADPVVLHPFDSADAFGASEPITILGRYGSGDAPRDADAIRATLYAAMEKGARRYFLEKGYYVRLALTTVSFIAVYLFLSILVRDPVPLIDELLLGTLAAATVFFASERKALSSPDHVESLLRLRKAIDGSYFTESRVVDLVEAWRDQALALGPAAFYKIDAERPALGADDRDEAAALCSMLAGRWKARPIVAEVYDSALKGRVPGGLLDKLSRRLGAEECALALAYIRLIPLALESVE